MNLKLWCYLSVALLCIVPSLGVGDTFGILQGTTYTQDLSLRVFDGELFLYETQVPIKDSLFATSVTIPASQSMVNLEVWGNAQLITTLNLSSGQTLQLNLQEQNIAPSNTIESFDFQPQENQEMINDISQGEIQDYKDEIKIESLEEIQESLRSQVPEQASVEQPTQINDDTTLEKVNSFFLEPLVLLALMLTCIVLIVLVILKRRGTTHL